MNCPRSSALRVLLLAAIGMSCAQPGDGSPPLSAPTSDAEAGDAHDEASAATDGPTAPPAALPPPSFGVTYHRLDGNRLATGAGTLSANTTLTWLTLPGAHPWIAGIRGKEGAPIWVVVDENGLGTRIDRDSDGSWVAQNITSDLAPGQPPAFGVLPSGDLDWWQTPLDASLTHPVDVDGNGTLVFVGRDGLLQGAGVVEPVTPLPDARIVVSGEGLVALTDPTSRFTQAALGDSLEAGAITWVRDGQIQRVEVPAPQVVEGTTPLWVDLDDDGRREVVVTVSDNGVGARVRVYDAEGATRAESAPTGSGALWRHIIAAGPFAPDGTTEIATVRAPHVAGVVEFFRLSADGTSLQSIAAAGTYTSHLRGTRGLDDSLAADVDGDGVLELVVPSANRDALCALSRTGEAEVQEDFCITLKGPQQSNIAAVTDADGRIWFAVATQDAVAIF